MNFVTYALKKKVNPSPNLYIAREGISDYTGTSEQCREYIEPNQTPIIKDKG